MVKRIIALLTVIAISFSMIGCGSKNVDNGEKEKIQKTLTIGTAQDINCLDLQKQSETINNNCLMLTHQALVYLTNDGDKTGKVFAPLLAESWEWENDNTLVFHLKDNIKFSDNTPLTAEDVVFTYEMAKKPDSFVSGVLNIVESVEARDEKTVVLHVTGYSNEILAVIALAAMAIQSKAAYESGMDKPYLIGSGQYKLKDWVQGQYASFVRNENYWGDDPGVAEEIIFKPILEGTSRVIALQNGEIDVCIDPPTTELNFLKDDKNITVLEQQGSRLFYLGFNCKKAPFDNLLFRQGVSCAINKEMVLEVALQGRGMIQNTVLNRGLWSFYDEKDLGAYTYDLERAKELIKKSGVDTSSLEIDLYSAADDPYKSIAPIIQGNLKDIGIKVNIVTFDQATIKTECQTGNQQMFLWRWNVIGNLDEVYSQLFGTDFPANYHHFSDPKVDEMAHIVLTEKDEDKRYNTSVELQKYLAEQCPQVPLYVADLTIAYKKGLSGTYLFGGGNHRWNHAYINLQD